MKKSALTEPPATFEEFYEYAELLTVDANGKNATEEGFDSSNVVQWGTSSPRRDRRRQLLGILLLCLFERRKFITKDYENMTYEVTCDSDAMVSSMQFLLASITTAPHADRKRSLTITTSTRDLL